MKPRFYYWDGSAVVEANDWQQIYQYCFYVDTAFDHSKPHQRYGQDTGPSWVPIPLEQFPAEFRAHLLIMGVL